MSCFTRWAGTESLHTLIYCLFVTELLFLTEFGIQLYTRQTDRHVTPQVTPELAAQHRFFTAANVVVAVGATNSHGIRGPAILDKFMKDLGIYSTEKVK